MNLRHLILFVCLLCVSSQAVGDTQDGPAIEEITDLKPDGAASGVWNVPLQIRTAEELKKHVDADLAGKLSSRIGFDSRHLLLFSWRGAEDDQLGHTLASDKQGGVVFILEPGSGGDIRSHFRLFAMKSDVEWKPTFAVASVPTSKKGGFLQGYLEPILGAWLYVDSYLWTIVGFMGAAVFGSRFLLQWLQSEKEKRLVVPWYFWHLSFWGSSLNMLYFLHLDKAPLILGNCFLPILYARNLILLHRGGKATLRSGDKEEESGK